MKTVVFCCIHLDLLAHVSLSLTIGLTGYLDIFIND